MKKFLSSIKNDFLDMLYPENVACVICGAELFENSVQAFCADCFAHLPKISGKLCRVCGTEISDLAAFCNRCQNTDFAFDGVRSPFVYEGELVRLIYGLKFGGKRYIARAFAPSLADALRRFWYGYDIIIPVPIHEKTLKKRGYNQAGELARELCKITGETPLLDEKLLIKTKFTAEQARLDKQSRAENLKASFAVVDKHKLKGKIVLLIDDVMTTGATASECASTLKKGGAEGVFVLTLAQTKHKLVVEKTSANE